MSVAAAGSSAKASKGLPGHVKNFKTSQYSLGASSDSDDEPVPTCPMDSREDATTNVNGATSVDCEGDANDADMVASVPIAEVGTSVRSGMYNERPRQYVYYRY